jgi:hypothetical protein
MAATLFLVICIKRDFLICERGEVAREYQAENRSPFVPVKVGKVFSDENIAFTISASY